MLRRAFLLRDVVSVAALCYLAACTPDTPQHFTRLQIPAFVLASNDVSGCVVSADYRHPTNALHVHRGDEQTTLALNDGESGSQMLSAIATNRVFCLTRKNLTELPVSGTAQYAVGYDFARVLEVELPCRGGALCDAAMRPLFTMDDLQICGMDSWVADLLSVTPDGSVLIVNRVIPEKTKDGIKRKIVKEAYKIETRVFTPVMTGE